MFTQLKVTEQYFPVALIIMLCKVVLIFQSVSEILRRDLSNRKSLEKYNSVVFYIELYKVIFT